jgi:uncharacterized protein (TIGR00255 family)
MTGFGTSDFELNNEVYRIEIKSLNNKGIDISTRLPHFLRHLDIELRGILQKNLQRGKIDFAIYNQKEKSQTFGIDEEAFTSKYNFLRELAVKVGASDDRLFSLALDKNGYQESVDELDENQKQELLNSIMASCQALQDYRNTEGRAVAKDLYEWIVAIENCIEEVKKQDPIRNQNRRDKIIAQMTDLSTKIDFDQNRLEQEMIYYIEKLDISEEISRITQHFALYHQTINGDEAPGKKLGFLVQEIGRELNTIGSKANDYVIQHQIVSAKEYLDKIREQINNIL